MNIQSFPVLVSVSDLQRDYKKVLAKLSRERGPVLVLRNNEIQAIMLSPQAYEGFVSELERYEFEHATKAISEYKKEKREKKLKKLGSPKKLFENES